MKPGFRITEMWAFTCIKDNEEVIPGVISGKGLLLMIATDMERVNALRPMVDEMVRTTGRTVTLKKFSAMETVEELAPGSAESAETPPEKQP